MTDTPGREPDAQEPDPEQRLPVPRPPSEAAPVERFTSPPPIRAFELTPERAAQVVRQSSNARWVGFLATVVVVLFVILDRGRIISPAYSRLERERMDRLRKVAAARSTLAPGEIR